MQAKVAELCSLGDSAAPLLLDAFRAGGTEAKLALTAVQQASLVNATCETGGALQAAVNLSANNSRSNLTDYRL